MKICTTSYDNGSAQAISRPIKRLIEEGNSVINWAVPGSKAVEYFIKKNVEFSAISGSGLEEMKELMTVEDPDVVLTGTSCSYLARGLPEQNMTAVARGLGIPSVAILDMPNRIRQRFWSREGLSYLPDRILLPDQFSADLVVKAGVPEDKMRITGNPYFDEINELRSRFVLEDMKNKVRARHRIDKDSYLLVFASQCIKEKGEDRVKGFDQYKVFDNFLEGVKDLRGARIIARPHPVESGEGLEEIAKRHNIPVEVTKEGESQEYLYAADLVVSMYSTALIEAAYLGTRGVSLQPGLKEEDILVTNRIGVTIPIYEKSKLRDTLVDLIYRGPIAQEQEKKLKIFSAAVDGKSTLRVIKEIYAIAGRR